MKYFPAFFIIFSGILGCAKTHLTTEQRSQLDQKAIYEITRALVELPESEKLPPSDSKAVFQEAEQIARALVNQTRETNKDFNMTTRPNWHNFLIKIGKRKGGYCYEWVPRLLQALPPYPMEVFERHWGGAFKKLDENNGVILTKKAAPIETGIVYDAWRGSGRPYWKYVAKDKKYPWKKRFSEAQILTGEAKVVPR